MIQDELAEHEKLALRGLEKLLREKREKREHHDQSDIETAFDADELEAVKTGKGWCPKVGEA